MQYPFLFLKNRMNFTDHKCEYIIFITVSFSVCFVQCNLWLFLFLPFIMANEQRKYII